MSVVFDQEKNMFFLITDNSEYQIKINEIGMLLHVYYGPQVNRTDMSYLLKQTDRGFSGNPYECSKTRGLSLDTLPQEYTGVNVGDLRISSIELQNSNGSLSCDWRYVNHSIIKGKYMLNGLPYVRGRNGNLADERDVTTLIIKLEDYVTKMEVQLLYGVFEHKDIITRAAQIHNLGSGTVYLEKASSICMDFPYGNYDLIHFHGKHCLERIPERISIGHDIITIGSRRGMSSHHNNPFVILADGSTTENSGNAYGFMMMYSGNHKTEVERDFVDNIRLVMGINDYNFRWKLNPEETFTTPEIIMAFTSKGLNDLSSKYHHIIRENIIDSKYYSVKRNVLINNWEATYFNFNEKKIIELADEASKLGIDMFVLDDGWFGQRIDDNAGLGDWYVNEDKLKGGIKYLVDEVNKRGMKFGLWFEPEMINEDSDLFRAHPDWVVRDPDRKPMLSRNQMVLDMSRRDVRDYLYEMISNILAEGNIEYVKWDFNRAVVNCYSNNLPYDQQGEFSHRFVLGTYSLLERLLSEFPNLMIEGCSGGGGRFDAGMLFYCPQVWTSDNTDPISRLAIQEGTSYGYPVCTMGAHVSASPNHQTKRKTSMRTRGIVAQSGTFGYELDITKLTDKEKDIVRKQIYDFHKYDELIRHGEYYRLSTGMDNNWYTCWEFVSRDRLEALVNIVINNIEVNARFPYVHLCGLDSNAMYTIENSGKVYSGASLMYGGYAFNELLMDDSIYTDEYPSMQIHLIKV